MAKSIMQSLMDHGKVVRGWLGVSIQNLDEAMAESFGFKGTKGVLIGDVTPDSPAEKAGLKQGDIIVKYDGKEMADANQLRQTVAATSPGTKVKTEVFREGERETVNVTVGELDAGMAVVKGRESQNEDLGMTLRNLTPEIAGQLELKQSQGVVVTEIEPFGLAAKAGLRPGDVIVAVQTTPVEKVSEFNQAVKKNDLKKGVRLTVLTEGMKRFVILKAKASEE
jgi:serine protease Do